MKEILYKDNKFELICDENDKYIIINKTRYQISSYGYKSGICIKSDNGNINIIINDFLNIDENMNPLEFCKIIESEILKDKAIKKQQIVKEIGCKTACNIQRTISYKERNIKYNKDNGYRWEDIENKEIKPIGQYWQAGIGTGIVNGNMIWYIYFGSPNRNDTFFTISEISEQEYFDLQIKYKDYIYDKNVQCKTIPINIVKEIEEYVLNSKIIVEGWNFI